jgi:hypothetical protein
MDSLGESMAEFTPRGGEEMFNAGRAGLKALVDPVESVYGRLLAKGGR